MTLKRLCVRINYSFETEIYLKDRVSITGERGERMVGERRRGKIIGYLVFGVRFMVICSYQISYISVNYYVPIPLIPFKIPLQVNSQRAD